jgi:glycosyltransferase involved in cell wall biosynthesis
LKRLKPGDPHYVDPTGLRGRHVIVLNWKDDQHPEAGGAETYCHAVATRFAQQGANVCLLTARGAGQSRRDTKGGVEIRRVGGKYSVYPLVLLQLLIWRVRTPWRLDLILDCQNGIPFFAPIVVGRRTAVVMLIFHVHQDQFGLYMSPVAAGVGRWLEGAACRIVYRRRTVAVISASTRQRVRDRLRLGGALFVVPCGSESVDSISAPRSKFPSVVCVGRMVPHKRVHLLLKALPVVISHHPQIHVDVIGEGPSRPELESLAVELGVEQHVTFHGHVSSARRDALASCGWLAVNPSMGEGWGLSIIEANAAGRPAVCLNVDGLRDAVRDGVTGWVAAHPDDLAEAMVKALNILSDDSEAALWSSRAQAWAASFSWDATAAKLSNVLLAESDRLASARRLRQRNDLALRVTVEGGTIENASRGRRTDVWREQPGGITGLLYGLDERDLRVVLDRLELGDPIDVHVARTEDLLLAPWSEEPTDTGPTSISGSKNAPLDIAK